MSSGPPGMYAPPPGQASMMPDPQGSGVPNTSPSMQWGQHAGKPELLNQGSQFPNGQHFNQMNAQMGQMNLQPRIPNIPFQQPTRSQMPPTSSFNQLPGGPMQPPTSQPIHSQPGMPPPSLPNSAPPEQLRMGPPRVSLPPQTVSRPSMPPHNHTGQPSNVGMASGPPNNLSGSGLPPFSSTGPGLPPTSSMAGQRVAPMNMNGLSMPPRHTGLPPQPMGHSVPTSNMHPHPGIPPQPTPSQMAYRSTGPGMPPPPGQGITSQPDVPPYPCAPQPGLPSQYGMLPQPGVPPQSGMTSQPGLPSQPGMPPQPGVPGMPPQPNMGGMPPGPGMPPMMGGSMPGQQYPPQQNQVPASRRLDAEAMPSAVQVMMTDMHDRSGVFQTAQRGGVPPLVTTNFTCIDQGNCSPRFMRSTMYNIPVTNDMMKQCNVPFGLICSPYARTEQGEAPPPLVDLGELGPIRCKRCRAYMSPYMQFVDGGRRFSCPFCLYATDVPPQYFQHLDHTGKRVDTYERPELYLGSYEFVATKDYCKNSVLPTQPAFIFMIDVSYNSVKSGLVHLLCQHLKDDILPNLPKEHGMEESEVRVGFVTYSNVLHFYNVKGSLVQPQMLVVSDVEDVFVPMVEGFLVRPSEASGVIESLLDQLPMMFADARETDVVLGPVIQAGLDALRSAGCPGKLFIFHSSLPIADAPGKLKQRADASKVLGTDKEKTAFEPQTPFYTTLGQECVTQGCGVDLFLFPNSYIDVATIGQVSKLTGGDIYKYDYFTAESHGTQFINDLRTAVGRQIAFDVIVRIRTSTGLRPVDFLGNFHMANTTDVELAVIDCDKAFAVEVKHDDKLTESDGAYVQLAMLFTSLTGQRRLRVHNLSLNVCSQMADVFKNAELDTLVNFLSKKAIRDQLLKTPKDVRESVMNQCADILACYRRNCATNTASGQLILPETMKLLPLYTNCLIKSDALQAGPEINADSRSTYMHMLNCMDIKSSVPFLYPRLLQLHDLDPEEEQLPIPIRCSHERLTENGAYLLENGYTMLLWLGHAVSGDFLQDVFGVSNLGQVEVEKPCIIEMNNPTSKRVHGIVRSVMQQRGRFMKLLIVRQRDKLEPWFNHYLVEDKGATGSPSYVDYLLHIHKEIRAI